METIVDQVTGRVSDQERSVEEPQVKAARIRAGLARFAHLRVSSEQFMREKQTELQQEFANADP
jgi:hypothetical protein